MTTELLLRKQAPSKLPRLGFLGVGWIGRHRLDALAQAGAANVAAVADASRDALRGTAAAYPNAIACESLDELLRESLDGVLIATPNAMHAEQAACALEHGVAVFCQKPLARTAAETRRVIEAARKANRLLGVDLSYRYLNGVERMRELIASAALGEVFAANLVFHNAYGPDKAWFYDAALSGGGCVIDLGSHLIDLALWLLPGLEVHDVESRLFAAGKPWHSGVEDYATARLELSNGCVVDVACSWRLHAGQDAVIEACFYGTRASVALRNLNGSFYDFAIELQTGTARELLAGPPDAWGGRAAVAWAQQLSEDTGFDPEIENLAVVASVIDRIYGR